MNMTQLTTARRTHPRAVGVLANDTAAQKARVARLVFVWITVIAGAIVTLCSTSARAESTAPASGVRTQTTPSTTPTNKRQPSSTPQTSDQSLPHPIIQLASVRDSKFKAPTFIQTSVAGSANG